MKIDIKILPAFEGDAIIIKCYKDDFKVLVDFGTKRSYSRGILKSELKKETKFDLLVLTHTDEDHIGGILKYFADKRRAKIIFDKIWFNCGEEINLKLVGNENIFPKILLEDNEDLNLSVSQGITLERKIKDEGLSFNDLIIAGNQYSFNNTNMIILSPEVEDLKAFYNVWEIETHNQLEMSKSSDYYKPIKELIGAKYTENGTLANKTSIAFILNYYEKKILLMGDAYPSIIEQNLRKIGINENNKLKLDAIKVSHHGSRNGISSTLLSIIDCTNYIISTNGSNGLPSKECLSRIITHRNDKISIFFNYKNDTIENIFSAQDFLDYNFEVRYLTNDNDYTITISD